MVDNRPIDLSVSAPRQPRLCAAATGEDMRPNRNTTLPLHHLDHLHHAQLFMVHHVAVQDKAASEIHEPRAKRDTALPWHDDRVAPYRIAQVLAVHSHHFEVVGVNVEDVVVGVLVDDQPLLHRTEWNPLITRFGSKRSPQMR